MNNSSAEVIQDFYNSIKSDNEITRPSISVEMYKLISTLSLFDFVDLNKVHIASEDILTCINTPNGLLKFISTLKNAQASSKFEVQFLITLLYLYYAVVYSPVVLEASLDPSRLKLFITCISEVADKCENLSFMMV